MVKPNRLGYACRAESRGFADAGSIPAASTNLFINQYFFLDLFPLIISIHEIIIINNHMIILK
jgi:hypothetical protein